MVIIRIGKTPAEEAAARVARQEAKNCEHGMNRHFLLILVLRLSDPQSPLLVTMMMMVVAVTNRWFRSIKRLVACSGVGGGGGYCGFVLVDKRDFPRFFSSR